MADSIELASCFVTYVPSMRGSRGAIAAELVPGAASAGEEAGAAAGKATSGTFLSRLSAMQGSASALWGSIAGASAIAGLGVGLYKVGEVFDEVTDTIRVGTGATGESLDGLTDVAKKIGATTPAEFSKIGKAVADVNTRLGLTGGDLETVGSQFLEVGRILGKDVDVNKASAAFSAFGIQGKDVAGAMDQVFRVSQATGVGFDQLTSSVAANAPALQGLGFSFENTVAMAGALDKAGLNSSKVMAGMGKALVTLAKQGEAPPEAFKRVTSEIKTLADSGRQAEAIGLAAKLFGTKNAPQFVQALQEGKIGVDGMMASIGASSDTILGVGKDTADFAENWQLVKNNALLALEPLGSAVFSALGNALQDAMPAFTAFAAWLSQNQWALAVVAGIIGVGLVVAFIAWTASIWASTIALLANPVTWIVLAIIALIAAIIALVMNWDTVVAFLTSVWNTCVDWLVSTFSAIGTAIGNFVLAAGAWFAKLGTDIWTAIVAAFNAVVGFFVQLGTDIWTAIVTAFNAVVAFFVQLGLDVWNAIVTGFNAVVGFFVQLGLDVWNTITAAFNMVVGFIAGIPGQILANLAFLGQLGAMAWGWFMGFLSSAINVGGQIFAFVASIPGRIFAGLVFLAQLQMKAVEWFMGFLSGAINVGGQIFGFVASIPGRIFAGLAYLGSLGAMALGWFMGMVHSAQNSAGQMLSLVSGIPGRVMGVLGNLGSLLLNSGRSLIQGLANGITNGIGAAIGAARDALSAVRNLFPFSPPKDPRSPFYGRGYVTYSGEAITRDLGEGMVSDLDRLTAAGVRVAAAARSALPTSADLAMTFDASMTPGVGNQYTFINPVAEKASESIRNQSAVMGVLS